MTMPHLMNCSHQGDGWCLQCVKEQGTQLAAARAEVARLREERAELREMIEGFAAELANGSAAERARITAILSEEINPGPELDELLGLLWEKP